MVVCPTCQTSYQEELNFCGSCGSDMRHPVPEVEEPDPWLGRTIEDRYKVLARIGRGGMGVVYRVEHLAMGKVAAMKVMHGELLASREALKRFRREAEAVSRLSHPNTVQVFDFGQTGNALYLVMEHVRGEDLGAILRRDKIMLFSRAAPILTQICGALSEAHDLGIIHRDLKPENVLVSRTKDGHDFVKVLDFGLAKMREGEELPAVTSRGALIGTPYYMSPEQIRSEGQPDARSDVYSLGALMYRMLCGVPPFVAETPIGVLTKHLTEDPPAPRTRAPEAMISGLAEAVVLRALQKRPVDRFQTIDEMREALEKARIGAEERPRHQPIAPGRRSSDGEEWQLGQIPTSRLEIGEIPISVPEPELSTGAIARLSRSDFDQYELDLKRQKTVRLALLPLALIGLGVGAFFLSQRTNTTRPREMEVEPNNDASSANVLGSGQAIRGKIGQRLSRDEGDRDVYRVPAASGGNRLLKIQLTGLPNMDLTLQINGAGGQAIANVDAQGSGEGEMIPNLRLSAEEHYIVVRAVRRPSEVPTENVTDEYALVAAWRPLEENEEAEPNDPPAPSMALRPGREVTGFLGRPGDVDAFHLEAPKESRFSLELRLPEGIDARLEIDGREIARVNVDGAWIVPVAGGQTITLSRRDLVGEKRSVSGNHPYRLALK